jgi:hypothetical protein
MSTMDENTHAELIKITRELEDEGRQVEAGWQVFRVLTMRHCTSIVELDKAREAFFAGAQHLFASILEGCSEPDADDRTDELKRMDKISAELDRFVEQFDRKYDP